MNQRDLLIFGIIVIGFIMSLLPLSLILATALLASFLGILIWVIYTKIYQRHI